MRHELLSSGRRGGFLSPPTTTEQLEDAWFRTKGSILGTLEENIERLIRNLEMAGVELEDEEDEGESGPGVLGETSDGKKRFMQKNEDDWYRQRWKTEERA
jgi:hypothetical protein